MLFPLLIIIFPSEGSIRLMIMAEAAIPTMLPSTIPLRAQFNSFTPFPRFHVSRMI